jgi:hypothetical protein
VKLFFKYLKISSGISKPSQKKTKKNAMFEKKTEKTDKKNYCGNEITTIKNRTCQEEEKVAKD